jgi:hypothetical protein
MTERGQRVSPVLRIGDWLHILLTPYPTPSIQRTVQ